MIKHKIRRNPEYNVESMIERKRKNSTDNEMRVHSETQLVVGIRKEVVN